LQKRHRVKDYLSDRQGYVIARLAAGTFLSNDYLVPIRKLPNVILSEAKNLRWA